MLAAPEPVSLIADGVFGAHRFYIASLAFQNYGQLLLFAKALYSLSGTEGSNPSLTDANQVSEPIGEQGGN
jgi:hypothetical protein